MRKFKNPCDLVQCRLSDVFAEVVEAVKSNQFGSLPDDVLLDAYKAYADLSEFWADYCRRSGGLFEVKDG